MEAHTSAVSSPAADVTGFSTVYIYKYTATSLEVTFDKIPVMAMITALIGLLFGEPARERPDACKQNKWTSESNLFRIRKEYVKKV